MGYCYVAIDKVTGVPIVGGTKKYHLKHAINNQKIDADTVRFYRVTEPSCNNDYLSKVNEIDLETVLNR